MSGRKNKFSKAMTHLKSDKIDEKIGYLNKEMKKMGVISEQPANSTSDLYCTTEYIPPVPESPAEYTDVPDPDGVRSDAWTQPSNGFDENDPSTWENAYNDFSWLYNPNDVAGETDRPVVQSVNPDWSGAAAGGGMAGAVVAHGPSLGYIADGVYKPLVTSNMFGSMVPPTDVHRGSPLGGHHYTNISDEQWAQMQSLYAAYQSSEWTTANIKMWYPFSYFWYGNWDNYNGVKKQTDNGRFVLINGFVSTNANQYESKPHENEIPGRTVVLTQHSLDDPNYFPGNANGFMNFLRNALDVGREALDWLLDQLDGDDELAGNYTSDFSSFGLNDDGTVGRPEGSDWGKDVGDEDEIMDLLGGERADAGSSSSSSSSDTTSQTSPFPSDPVSDAHPGFANPGDEVAFFGGNKKSPAQKAVENTINLVGNAGQYQTKSRINREAVIARENGYSGDTSGIIRFETKFGISVDDWFDPRNWLPDGTPNLNDPNSAWNKHKNENYEPQGELIKEGWESPKHTYIDKDQQKRWFKEKDVAPVYPKKAPPKMIKGYHPDLLPKLDTPIPQIKVRKKDLLRGHHLKKDQAQKLIDLVDRLNDYIKRNPEHLAYARERYPKHDPRLAALNYKMDMQLAAADEYVEKHFPENKRLLNKVLKATKQSIKLTDPKTFKSKDGVFTTFNKLERARHFDNEYKPKERKVVKKRRGKSVSRFFYKPKKKSKYDILKDKMVVLDKEMKKMMPDA